MLVLARVRSSPRLTITAQAVAGPGSPFFSGFAGSMPGTTTAYSGTSPIKVSPVLRSTILVEAPRNTPIASTAPLRTITPSATSLRAPARQSASIITGCASSGPLAARADEAVVLDDPRLGLQRLEHAADTDAAGDVHALADLRAASHRRP